MAYIYAKINKDTIKFIREQRNISFEYISRVAKFNREKIELWESADSDKWPTINQAKILAKCYHVPFAGFYMNPEDIDVKKIPQIRNKRTIINATNDETVINLAIMDLLFARDFYLETKHEFNESIPEFDLRITGNNVIEWAEEIKRYLEINIADQYRSKSTRQLYLYLREKIESKGIFVQCYESVEPEIMRGVAIYDKELSIIGINDNDRYPAKSFTMLHEIVHLIKRSSSMCNDISNAYSEDSEEIFCNAVAGEILVPTEYLLNDFSMLSDSDFDLRMVDRIADKYSVSSEVFARRLLDVQICSKSWYKKTSEDLAERFIRSREEAKQMRLENGNNGIPRNMPREAVDRTSSDMCRILARGYGEGIFDKSDISRCIGIKEKHINNFIWEVLKWNY